MHTRYVSDGNATHIGCCEAPPATIALLEAARAGLLRREFWGRNVLAGVSAITAGAVV